MMNSEEIHPNKNKKENGVNTSYCGSVSNLNVTEHTLELEVQGKELFIEFLSEKVFRLKINTFGNLNKKTTDAIVIKKQNPKLEIEESEIEVKVKVKHFDVIIEKHPFNIKVLNAKGEEVLSGLKGEFIGWNDNKETICQLNSTKEERFYGFGEKTGFLNKKGTNQVMWNSDVYAPHNEETNALYQSIPFYINTDGENYYGLLLDNSSKVEYNLTEEEKITFKVNVGSLDFYYIYGENLKEVIMNYTELTGKTPMPPKWALGYQQSRYSYQTEEELLEIAETFREKEIPCDVLYLDIHHMDEYRVFTWHPTHFANMKETLKTLKEKGFHVIPIVDPGVKIDPNYETYKEGIENNYFSKYFDGTLYSGAVWAGDSHFPDFSEERVRQWWGENHEFFTQHGIKGIWNDMNEPSVFNDKKTMDDEVYHLNDGEAKTHKEFHNLYGFNMSKGTYEGLEKLLKGERPFVVTRAGYAGIQRYAAIWTGDNRSFWEHLAMSIPMFLNLGMSGVAFVGSDVGGFAHPTNGQLLARWTQFGAFTPFFRNHSAIDVPYQEPWKFGAEIEEICKKYIQLRYKLMPYFYNVMKEATETGLPFLRPLVLEYPTDKNVFNMSEQLLVGESILLAPVTRPDTLSKAVYLPEGIWYDYWTGETHNGGKTILKETPLDTMPIYIKEGSVIPQGPVKQHVYEENDDLSLSIYPTKGITKYEHYEDDGKTFEFKNGLYNKMNVNYELNEAIGQLTIKYQNRQYETKRDKLHIKIKSEASPSKIVGNETELDFDYQNGMITFEIADKMENNITIYFN